MRAIGFVFLGMFLSLNLSAGASTVRYVFKNPGPTTLLKHSASLKPMTFGLNSKQVEGIKQLSGIDFGNVLYMDADASDARTLATHTGYSGIIYPNVPPPAVVVNGDKDFVDQWWVNQIHAKEAWSMATGKGVTIADCDAGYYLKETDLAANMLADLAYDFSDTDNPQQVEDGPYVYHGTAVAAIMMGVLDGLGTNGIAFDAKLVPFQNFNYSARDKLDKEEATAQCILKAITTPNVQIIVLENQTRYGSSETFVGTRDAVRLALKAGITIVSAAGNSGVPLTEEVKDDTGSILVGALKPDDTPESFSNFGSRVTVAAYGEKLQTLYGPNGVLGEFGGTSGATPQVAATVALLKEVNPLFTPQQVKDLLVNTRVITDANRIVGGRVDVLNAVTAAKAAPTDFNTWTEHWLFRQQLSAILGSLL